MPKNQNSHKKGYQIQAQTRSANRETLLKAGLRAFGEIGYDAATVRDILGHTNLSPGTFYNHFTDKEDIFRELLHGLADKIRITGKQARAEARTPEEFFRNTFQAFFSVVASDPLVLKFIARNQVNIRMARHDRIVEQLFHDTQQELEYAVARGVLPGIPIATFHRVGFGAFFEIVGALVGEAEIDVEKTIAELTILFAGAARAFSKITP